jgi:hypothetical protein
MKPSAFRMLANKSVEVFVEQMAVYKSIVELKKCFVVIYCLNETDKTFAC